MLDKLSENRRIVQQVIDLFGSQEKTGEAADVDQSAVSLWLKKGVIPAARQRLLLDRSKTMHAAGQLERALEPKDFFELRETQAGAPDAKPAAA